MRMEHEPVGLMRNLLRGRETVQNILIFRYIVTTMRLKFMLLSLLQNS